MAEGNDDASKGEMVSNSFLIEEMSISFDPSHGSAPTTQLHEQYTAARIA